MDFSSVPRALESLNRRHPPLDDQVLKVAESLLQSPNNDDDSTTQSSFCNHLSVLLEAGSPPVAAEGQSRPPRRWESLAVGLYVATEVLSQQISKLEQRSITSNENKNVAVTVGGEGVYMDGPRVPSIQTTTTSNGSETPQQASSGVVAGKWTSPDLEDDEILSLCKMLHPVALDHLEDSEPRVRALVAKAAGVYCKATVLLQQGESLRIDIHSRVVSSIQQHLAQGRKTAEEAGSNFSKSSTGALDDTTGWRALETNWQCLAALISAMGPLYLDDFGAFSDQLLQDCQHSCVVHVNRHVRAAGMAVLEQCVAAAVRSPVHSASLLADTQSSFSKTMVVVLRDGLAVRFC